MKKLLTTITAGVLACSTPAFAAEETKPAPDTAATQEGLAQGIERRIQILKEVLALTPEQVEKIRPLMERDGEKLRAIASDASLSQDARRAKMREVTQASGESINGILTAEQKEKWKQQAAKRRAEAQKARGQGGN